MSRPRQWTSSGVGSAIPATELGTTGSLSTGVMTVPESVFPATTQPSITMIATMTGCENCPPWNTTIAGPTEAVSTQLASTVVFSTGILAPSQINGESAAAIEASPKTSLTIIFSFVITLIYL